RHREHAFGIERDMVEQCATSLQLVPLRVTGRDETLVPPEHVEPSEIDRIPRRTVTQLTQHIDADTAPGEHHRRRATRRLYFTERDRQPCCTGPCQRFGTVVADHLDPTHRVFPFPLAAFLPVPLLYLPAPPL